MKLNFTVKDIFIHLKSFEAQHSAQIETLDMAKHAKNSIVMQFYSN